MATIPTPATQTAGVVVTAATINSQGNLATYLAGRVVSGGARKPMAILRQTVAQSIPNTTGTVITFDTEDVDYDNGHSTVTNTSRYTVNTAGLYLVTFTASFASNATGYREVSLTINGGPAATGSSTMGVTGATTDLSGAAILNLATTQYLELNVQQASGGALNTSVSPPHESTMAVAWLSV